MSEVRLPSGWSRVTLADITEPRTERVGRTNRPIVLSSTKHHGLVPSDDFFKGRAVYSGELAAYKVVRRNWFAYATNHLAEGSIGIQLTFDISCVSPIYTVFSCKDGVDPSFLFRVLKSPRLLAFYAILEQASVDRRGAVRYKDLAKIAIDLPPVVEQQRIGEMLDTVDDQIGHLERMLSQWCAIRVSMLVDLLTRDSIYSQSIESLLAPGPDTMRSGPFGSGLLAAELQSSGVPVLGIDNVEEDRFVPHYSRFVGMAKFGELQRYKVKPGDIMVTIMGTVGRCCVVPEDIGLALSSKHVWTITLDWRKYRPWLASLQINYAPWAREHFRRESQGGVMSAIRSETLRTLRLPTPPLEAQVVIENAVRAQTERITRESETLNKLRLVQQGLMEDLLSGRARVTRSEELTG